jgi:hypothetical protein
MPGILIGTKVRDTRFPNKVGILSSKGEKFWTVINEETKAKYLAPGRFWRRWQPRGEQRKGTKSLLRRSAYAANSPYSEIPADKINGVIELAKANGVSVSFAWAALNE